MNYDLKFHRDGYKNLKHNIVSRKITKVVTQKSIMSNADFEEKRNTFIKNVKH